MPGEGLRERFEFSDLSSSSSPSPGEERKELMSLTKTNLGIREKTILVLTDFFLPLETILPTIQTLTKAQNKVIVAGFFGKESLAAHANSLAKILNRKFIDLPTDSKRLPEYDIPHLYFAHDPQILSGMRSGDITVVENLNLLSSVAVGRLAVLASVLVNDDFSAPDTAVDSLRKHLPSKPGLLYARTARKLEQFLSRSKKPVVLVLGGLALAGKEQFLDKLMRKADKILVGGGIANLFFKLRGLSIGKSSTDVSADMNLVKKLLRDYGSKIVMPVDVVVAAGAENHPLCKKPDKIGLAEKILDVGPQTTLAFSKILKTGRTIIWSGTLGEVESPSFRHGTEALLRLAASRLYLPERVFAASGQTVMDFLDKQGMLADVDLPVTSTTRLFEALTR